MGRVDLHNHLLYGLDDGAATAAESLELGKVLLAAGYTDVACTPHAKPDMDPSLDAANARRAEIQALFDANDVALRLHPGCENHLTPLFLERLDRQEARRLGSGKYVLVELPFASPVPGLRELLFQIMLKGVRPIIAHPERCAQFAGRKDAAQEVVDAGAALQIEVGSLAGIYGGPAKKIAQAMLDQGLVAYAATDAHHPQSAREILGPGLRTLAKVVGPTRFQLFTEENPARVLRGDPLLVA